MHSRIFLILVTLLITFESSARQQVEFSESHIRKPIPGMSKTAGYGTLINHGETDVVFVSASSNLANKVEFHDMSMEDGVMKMRKLDQIMLKPNQSVSFQSGGKHLMFFGVRLIDEKVSLQLIEDNGKVHSFNVELKDVMRSVDHTHH